MSIFKKECQHQWDMVGVHFNPSRGEFSGKNLSSELVRELMYGITTVTQQCSVCGYTNVTRHAGQINYDGDRGE